jgi:hypothetical protein
MGDDTTLTNARRCASVEWANAIYRIRGVCCRLEEFDERLPPVAGGFVLWRPPFEAVAVSPDRILRELQEAGIDYHTINNRYQAKLEVYSRLDYVLMETDQFSEPRTWGSLANLQRELGGHWASIRPLFDGAMGGTK